MSFIGQCQRDVVAFFLAVVLAVGATVVCVAFGGGAVVAPEAVAPSALTRSAANTGAIREASAAPAPASALLAPSGS